MSSSDYQELPLDLAFEETDVVGKYMEEALGAELKGVKNTATYPAEWSMIFLADVNWAVKVIATALKAESECQGGDNPTRPNTGQGLSQSGMYGVTQRVLHPGIQA